VRAWQQVATSDLRQIRAWWKHWPHANIGIVTGDGLVVLDIDRDHGGFESLARLEAEHGLFPETVTVETGGGGQHRYFLSTESIRNSAGRLGDGLDIRGDGGYIIVPPSLHRSGRRYQYANGLSPKEVETAPPPDWIIEELTNNSSTNRKASRDWREISLRGVSEGSRNNTLASVAGLLFRKGVNGHLAYELLVSWNQTHNDPPLSDDEVTRTIASIARKEHSRLRRG
jgi:hypothetical protein